MEWYTGVGMVVALAGCVLAYLKFKPESTKIFVDTAKVSVQLANDARADLQTQVTQLANRLLAVEAAAAESHRVALAANSRADRLQAQLSGANAKVRRLEGEIKVLRQQLDDQNIEPVIPDTEKE